MTLGYLYQDLSPFTSNNATYRETGINTLRFSLKQGEEFAYILMNMTDHLYDIFSWHHNASTHWDWNKTAGWHFADDIFKFISLKIISKSPVIYKLSLVLGPQSVDKSSWLNRCMIDHQANVYFIQPWWFDDLSYIGWWSFVHWFSHSLSPVSLIEVEWCIYASLMLPSSIQIMACCLLGSKPLSEPMLEYC